MSRPDAANVESARKLVRRNRTTPGEAMNLDAKLRLGGKVVICREGGDNTVYEPLAPALHTQISFRVRYRCGACSRSPAAEVEHFTAANGTEVLCFIGKCYLERDDGQRVGFTRYAFIEPDYGAEPLCECPEHGPLELSRTQLRRDIDRSIAVQLRQSRTGSEKVTRTVRLRPRQESHAAD